MKVVEFQRRGLVHLHVVLRADGAEGPLGPAVLVVAERWTACLTDVAASVRVALGRERGRYRWGEQHDVRELVRSDGDSRAIAAYIAKYATKTADGLALGPPDPIPRPGQLHDWRSTVDAGIVSTAWGWVWPGFPDPAGPRPPFGYPGQFATKSTRYSTTFGALRGWRAAQFVRGEGYEPIPVDGGWRYRGRGYRNPAAQRLAEAFVEARFGLDREVPTPATRDKAKQCRGGFSAQSRSVWTRRRGPSRAMAPWQPNVNLVERNLGYLATVCAGGEGRRAMARAGKRAASRSRASRRGRSSPPSSSPGPATATSVGPSRWGCRRAEPLPPVIRWPRLCVLAALGPGLSACCAWPRSGNSERAEAESKVLSAAWEVIVGGASSAAGVIRLGPADVRNVARRERRRCARDSRRFRRRGGFCGVRGRRRPRSRRRSCGRRGAEPAAGQCALGGVLAMPCR